MPSGYLTTLFISRTDLADSSRDGSSNKGTRFGDEYREHERAERKGTTGGRAPIKRLSSRRAVSVRFRSRTFDIGLRAIGFTRPNPPMLLPDSPRQMVVEHRNDDGTSRRYSERLPSAHGTSRCFIHRHRYS